MNIRDKILLLVFLYTPLALFSQKYWKTAAVHTDFYSSAPIEDITAVSKNGISIIDSETREISFKIPINSFQFRKALMQEHFNEKFMESERFPAATFKGKIKDDVDLLENGNYPVNLEGILEVHGVKKKRIIPATLIVDNEKIQLQSRFDVACEDHNIKIPQILWQNIAEVVQVNVNAHYTKLNK